MDTYFNKLEVLIKVITNKLKILDERIDRRKKERQQQEERMEHLLRIVNQQAIEISLLKDRLNKMECNS